MDSCDARSARRSVGVETVDVDPVGAGEARVHGGCELRCPRPHGRRPGRVAGQLGHLRDPVERVDPEDVARRVGGDGEVVVVGRVPLGHVGQPVEQPGVGPARPPDPVADHRRARGEGRHGVAVAGREVVAPQPLRVALGEGGDVPGSEAVGVDDVDPAVGPETGLPAGDVAQSLPRQVLLAVGAHDRLGLVGRVPQELGLLAGGGVDELLVAAVQARTRVERPHRIEPRVAAGEGRRPDLGHGGVTGQRVDLSRPDRLRRAVDLEVAEAEVGERLEALRPVAHHVGVGEVRPLRPVGGRDRAVGVEQVPGVHGHRRARLPRREIDARPGRVDRAEVEDHRAGSRVGAERVHGDRRDDVLRDPGALGVRPGERRRAGRTGDGGRLPVRVVVTGAVPPRGVLAGVDPLDEVAGVGVALRRRQPLGRALPPAPVGAEDDVTPVVVPQRELDEEPGRRGRPALARSVPAVQDAEGAGPAARHRSGEVHGAGVLLVGIAEARPRVGRGAVDEEAVRVRRGEVGRGAGQRARRRRDLRPHVRHPVGLPGGGGGPEPSGRPVGVAQRGGEPPGPRYRPPLLGVAPRLHGPLVGGVGGEGRTPVGDEGLAGREHRAAVPGRRPVPGVGPRHPDAGARLPDLAARGVQGPGERAPVGVDAHGVHEAVHGQAAGVQGPGRSRGDALAPHRLRPVPRVAAGSRGTGRVRAGGARRDGGRGHPGRGGQERAPAEPGTAHGDLTRRPPARCRGWRRCRSRPPTARPRGRPASPSG